MLCAGRVRSRDQGWGSVLAVQAVTRQTGGGDGRGSRQLIALHNLPPGRPRERGAEDRRGPRVPGGRSPLRDWEHVRAG